MKFLASFSFWLLILTVIIVPITYCQVWVESSNGLVPPEMEGGNTELEFADIDLDGNIDLLSIGDHGSPYINTDQHGIMIWFGDGNWSVYQNGNFGYGGIAIGDVNNDVFPDVGYGMHHNYSSTDFGDQLIEVVLGNGTGINWAPYDDGLATAGESWGMFGTDFADIDADGLLDLVSVSFGYGSGIHVYRNNGDGTWSHTYGYNGGNCGLYVEFGDINRDGYPDIASTTADSAIFINDGNGGFQVLIGGGITPPTYYGYNDIALGDVDYNGADEVAIATLDGIMEVWRLDDDGETWTDLSYNLREYDDVQMIDLADMNADGFLDVVAFGESQVNILAGNGGNSWTLLYAFNTPLPGYARALRAGADADHNGYGDIALVSNEGNWPSWRNHTHFYKENSSPEQVSVVPVYPHGNEIIRGGSTGWVEWISAVPSGQTTTVDIELSYTGSGGPYQLMAEGIPNNGKYQLNWPDGINSENCFTKITVYGETQHSAVTPYAFEIRSTSPSCNYVPGDINGDGNVMGNDVTYGVCYFKGLGAPPPDSCWNDSTTRWLYSAGDANGNCQFSGSDITFLVAYFKGYNPSILWCPDTPPIGGPLPLTGQGGEKSLILTE